MRVGAIVYRAVWRKVLHSTDGALQNSLWPIIGNVRRFAQREVSYAVWDAVRGNGNPRLSDAVGRAGGVL